MSITSDIGIMQGRLSPRVDGKIQAFPKNTWKNEFKLAKEIGFTSIEWIIENPLHLNPLLSEAGINQLNELIQETNVKVDFICADIFMETPIIEESKVLQESSDLLNLIIQNAHKIGAKCIEIPFVDKSSLRNRDYKFLISFFNSFEEILQKYNLLISLETDLEPIKFKQLLSQINLRIGANYDIGNSASLGYDFEEELNTYGERIFNLHIKDRKLGGSTVEFGTGSANIEGVLKVLSNINYKNGIIIQGARGEDDIFTAKSQFNYTKKIIQSLNNE